MNYHNYFAFVISLISFTLLAQEKKAGPVIKDYGKVWAVENPDFITPLDVEYKVVFDIMNSPESNSDINASIETAARFLNMHAQSGVPVSQLKAVLVVHNRASKDIANNTAYNARYGMDNPNLSMVEELMEAGVEIIFCGQSSNSRGFAKEDLIPGVQLSLSAMTALIHFQNAGYRLIKF